MKQIEGYLIGMRTELNNLMTANILSEYGRSCLEQCVSSLQMVIWDVKSQYFPRQDGQKAGQVSKRNLTPGGTA